MVATTFAADTPLAVTGLTVQHGHAGNWFWWWINAWAEISAMAASLIAFLIVSRFVQQNEYRLVIVALFTIAAWLLVTFLTPPESRETLQAFYRKVRPGGPGWKPISREVSDVKPDRFLGALILIAIMAAAVVYLTLPAVGAFIFGDFHNGLLLLSGIGITIGLAFFIIKRKIGWENIFS